MRKGQKATPEMLARMRKNRPYECLLVMLRARARRKGQECSLSYDEFFAFTQILSCFYCQGPIAWTMYDLSRNSNAVNLDRKDCKKGYSADNCVVCCHSCNTAKGDRYTFEEFVVMMNTLLEFRKSTVTLVIPGISSARTQ